VKGDALDVIFNNFRFNNKILRRVRRGLDVGLQQQFSHVYSLSYDSVTTATDRRQRQLLVGDLRHLKQYQTVSGLGLALLYDSRDNIVNPFVGYYADVSFTAFRSAFGSNYNFTNFSLDLRHYNHNVFHRDLKQPFVTATLAINFIANINTAKFNTIDSLNRNNRLSYIENRANRPPVYQLASLGGNIALRGFYRGRFKDIDALILQAEYRQYIYGRFGMTVFGGAGEVASKLNDFNFNSLNYSYGFGLRVMLKKEERLNLRLDVGFGNADSRGVYAGISEAF
jgi:outer membrane protein assembly factor BamA